MSDTKEELKKLQELQDLASIDLTPELQTYEQEVLQQAEQEMLDLLATETLSLREWEKQLTYEQLISCTFARAKFFIFRMELKKRISMLKQIDIHLTHCYQVVKKYNDQGFGKSMSPKDFHSILGKIKHLEILRTWLYGIE